MNDYWIRWGQFHICFLKNFALARSKDGLVSNFGWWEHGKWIWEIEIRMQVFDWKVDIWDEFKHIIEGVFPCEGTRDQVIWAPSNFRRFFCRSFRRSLRRVGYVTNRLLTMWDLPTPMKVECFVWLLLRDRNTVKDRLHRLRMVQEKRNVPYLWGCE